ncbi:protein translocase subunit SecDF, partial [Escherichia coli]|nr:protein translocase subunit SecDF [Escherichia coli]
LQVFVLSVMLSVASVVLLFTVKPNFGIDFTGGTIIEVRAKAGEADTGDIRQRLAGVGIHEVQVQSFGDTSDALIRIGAAPDTGETAGNVIVQDAQQVLAEDYDIRRTELVGPTVSNELMWSAILGVLAALAGI